MTYLDALAQEILAALTPGTNLPDRADDLFRMYAVLARAKGAAVTASDIHDAWSAWQIHIDPEHPALVPFEDLPEDVAREDLPFLDAVRTAAARLSL